MVAGDHVSAHIVIPSKVSQFVCWVLSVGCHKTAQNVFSMSFSIALSINLSSCHNMFQFFSSNDVEKKIWRRESSSSAPSTGAGHHVSPHFMEQQNTGLKPFHVMTKNCRESCFVVFLYISLHTLFPVATNCLRFTLLIIFWLFVVLFAGFLCLNLLPNI